MTTPPGTLTQHPHINQGTDEWHDARRGILTASVIGRFVTPKTIKPANNETTRALTAELVAERITGRTDPTFISDDMARGIEDEPRARDLYAERYAPVVECGFMVRTGDDWKLGYSPDGLVGDDGLIEIKSRRPKKHLATILANTVPSENLAQIQCGLLVSGRQWADYVSYCGGMPMWHQRVYPDKRWFDAILTAAKAFEETAAQMIATYEASVAGLPETEYVPNNEVELVL